MQTFTLVYVVLFCAMLIALAYDIFKRNDTTAAHSEDFVCNGINDTQTGPYWWDSIKQHRIDDGPAIEAVATADGPAIHYWWDSINTRK
jgi:hypothetical protein